MSERAGAGLSATLAQHFAQVRFSDLSQSTIWAAKRAILDGIGVMLAASGESADVQPFVHLAMLCGGLPQASLLGRAERVSAPAAALANGALAHALDFEDAFDRTPLHPNASLLPATLAISELQAPVSGADYLAAVATGCDFVCRLGLSLRRPMESQGWYPPPILGAFGATVAAAMLMRLDARRLNDALSLLLCQNSCPGEIKYSPDTVIRAIREAFPAQAAVTSALLAARGVRGFDAPLEGRSGFYALFAGGEYDPRALLDLLGKRNWIEELSFKQWPCCRGTHAYIEAARVLRRSGGFVAADVERLQMFGGDTQQMLCEPRLQKLAPRTQIDAKFSLPFVVAAALLQDEITLGSFSAEHLANPALLALAAKAEFQAAPQWQDNPAGGALTVTLRDGRRLQHAVAQAAGDPARPLSDATLRAKFLDCAARAAVPLTRPGAERLADRIFSLEFEEDAGLVLSARHP
jgi:2-methylcitrate dehydratase PrpD